MHCYIAINQQQIKGSNYPLSLKRHFLQIEQNHCAHYRITGTFVQESAIFITTETFIFMGREHIFVRTTQYMAKHILHTSYYMLCQFIQLHQSCKFLCAVLIFQFVIMRLYVLVHISFSIRHCLACRLQCVERQFID